MNRTLLVLGCCLLAGAPLPMGCAQESTGTPAPTGRPSYPTGLAMHPATGALAVVSSNFDRGYGSGALLLASIEEIDAELAALDAADPAAAVVTDGYASAAYIPSFGHKPIFSADGRQLLLATRGDNLLIGADVTAGSPPRLACDADSAEDTTPDCGQSPSALTISGNDPYSLALTSESDDQLSGVVGSLRSDRIVFFQAVRQAVPLRLQRIDELVLGDWLTDEDVIGVRAVAVRKAAMGVGTLVFALVERSDNTAEQASVDLIWFSPSEGGRARVDVLSLTEQAGSISARDMVISTDGDALFVALRTPDAVARVDLFAGGAFAPHVAAVSSACAEPVSLATGRLTDDDGITHDRVYVTCFADDAVLGFEASALEVTDALRFFGDGPYGIAIDTAHEPPRAYVSYFLDDSIGIFDLRSDDIVQLTPRGRIGQPRPIAERGAP